MRYRTWEGSCNLRDLGGLRRHDGSITSAGQLFRSGRTESLTETGWRSAQKAGVRTVVDLRNADEISPRSHDPKTDPPPITARFHRPIEDQRNTEFMSRYGRLLAHPAYYTANFEYFPHLLGPAITTITTAPKGLLFHCSAGKDRTGLIAAILLTINGVVLDDVLGDYETGVRGYSRWQHQHPGQGRERTLTDAELDDAVAERVQVLGSWLGKTDLTTTLIEDLSLGEELVETASQLLRS